MPAELDFLASCVSGERLSVFLEIMTKYGRILYETNEVMNLTAIPPEGFWTKHVCDSVSILRAIPELRTAPPSALMLDLGCGAGLPSVVLAAAVPGLHITAMDSRGKKADFVERTARTLGLDQLRGIHARAGEMQTKDGFRSAFTFITARAVGASPALWKEASGLLNRNGEFLIYRTVSQTEGELEELKTMKQGPQVRRTEPFQLPGDAGERMFLILNRDRQKRA